MIEQKQKFCTINSAQLKGIAAIIMALDHFSAAFFPFIPLWLNTLLRNTGRAAAPLFLFLVSEALKHTKNKKKYLMRIYFFNIVYALSFIPYSYLIGFSNASAPSVLSTYIFTIIFVLIIELIAKKGTTNKIHGIGLLLVIMVFIPLVHNTVFENVITFFLKNTSLQRYNILFVLRSILPDWRMVDYSILFSIMGVVFYYCKNRVHYTITLTVFCILSKYGFIAFDRLLGQYSGYFSDFFTVNQYFMILCLPFIMLYSGERGKNNKAFFYFFYPLHIYLFGVIAWIVKK